MSEQELGEMIDKEIIGTREVIIDIHENGWRVTYVPTGVTKKFFDEEEMSAYVGDKTAHIRKVKSKMGVKNVR